MVVMKVDIRPTLSQDKLIYQNTSTSKSRESKYKSTSRLLPSRDKYQITTELKIPLFSQIKKKMEVLA